MNPKARRTKKVPLVIKKLTDYKVEIRGEFFSVKRATSKIEAEFAAAKLYRKKHFLRASECIMSTSITEIKYEIGAKA